MANKKTKNQNNKKGETKNKKIKQEVNQNSKDKKNTNNVVQPENNGNEVKKLIKIILIITAIMGLFYIITMVSTKKANEITNEQKRENNVEKAVIQYEEIMIGQMLNYDGTYYVLIKKSDDNRLSEYESLITIIESNEDSPTIYSANLEDIFNKKHLAKEGNYKVEDLSEFAVTGTTLVKVVDHKIDSVYDNYDAIKNKLNELK